MPKNVIITNLKKLEKIKQKIAKDGVDKLHILADFDRTLTKAFVAGKETPSLLSILRSGNLLTADYTKKAIALFEKYHPIEVDQNIPLAKRKKEMQKWWTTHFKLLIKTGLKLKDVKRVIDSGKIQFRKGALQFFDLLYRFKIPLVVMSASGLGTESISMYFKNKKRLYPNIYIISNSLKWSQRGKIIGVKKPIIHSLNKDETMVKNFPVYKIIKKRKNVILLGDNLSDIGMIKGFRYDNLIKIGFLNKNVKENLKNYRKNFDIVITKDSEMTFVNKLLKEIIAY
ncbi:MAG: hypothetical protein V1892_02075 [bacterium]